MCLKGHEGITGTEILKLTIKVSSTKGHVLICVCLLVKRITQKQEGG